MDSFYNKSIDFLYCNSFGRAATDLLLKRKALSSLFGIFCSSKLSKRMIKGFIKKYNIDMSQFKDIKYNNFNEFFAREFKSYSFEKDSDIFISPCEGYLSVFENVDRNHVFQAKDSTYTIKELLNNEELAEKYNGGTLIRIRLAPENYHRIHFFDSGFYNTQVKIKGNYYSVAPKAAENVARLYCKNKREYSILNSDNFGDVVMCEVGAAFVGSVVSLCSENSEVSRGQQKSCFKFGGSMLLLLFKKNKLEIFNEFKTNNITEVSVKLGDKIGIKLDR